jgi:hypothetical protein
MQSFGSSSPRGARSKGDQQPDGRITHNQKLQNILGIDIGILATQVLRARKTRKWETRLWDGLCEKHAYEMAAYEMIPVRSTARRDTPIKCPSIGDMLISRRCL